VSYCPSVFQAKRFNTREVFIGNVAIGADHPIRIQSMTTFDAGDVRANVEQILQLQEAGCDIVRLAIQGKKQILGLEKIKADLQRRGCFLPLVADVHFSPESALLAADIADKVRINPGNFLKILPEESPHERIEEKLLPLIRKCQKRKISLRLGSNSGSLSERILYLYGNTPKGMVFSAIEYAEVCRKFGFHDLVFSMKASNPLTTIAAYRLLVAEMIQRGWSYPIHLGVTEAGEGEEGRIKSSVGIGSLLLDGIGDTIRVSLTESPLNEMPLAKILIKMSVEKRGRGIVFFEESHRKPLEVLPRKGAQLFLKLKGRDLLKNGVFSSIIEEIDEKSLDGIYLDDYLDFSPIEPLLLELQRKKVQVVSTNPHPLCLPVVSVDLALLCKSSFALLLSSNEEEWKTLFSIRPEMIFFRPNCSPLHETRKFYHWLQEHRIEIPLFLDFPEEKVKKEEVSVYASSVMGALLCDGIGNGVLLPFTDSARESCLFGLRLLQACRIRMSRTEFISCPGCGRTLFDIQSLVRELKGALTQFPGVKIAVMGCIVNGPGEMEDADFGVVGARGGKVDLYMEKKCVEKNIRPEEIKTRLIALIRKQAASRGG
jgi:(E)-4-hydroxy-3-methylbut-2-enyl-diphosphate synthase